MPTPLLTDWLTIGTSGPTIDKRVIKPESLIEAAESYDPAEYTAVANADHWFGNYGSVRELRTIKDGKGRTALQARLRPNKYYLMQNAEDLRLFFSMELTPNFAETGKTYLTGLATTDKPASLGTSEVHFTAKKQHDVYIAEPVEFSTAQLKLVDAENSGLYAVIANAVKDYFFSNKQTPTQEEPQMTTEQFKALTDGQTAITVALAKLPADIVGAVEKLNAKPDNDGKDDGKGDGKGAATTDFSAAIAAAVKPLTEKLESFGTKLEAAVAGKNGTTFTPGTGDNDDGKINFV